jgi:hypothetical protein
VSVLYPYFTVQHGTEQRCTAIHFEQKKETNVHTHKL